MQRCRLWILLAVCLAFTAIVSALNWNPDALQKIREIVLDDDHHHHKKPDIHDLPVPEMIEKAGYPAETHMVTTDDCYILQIHRIPGKQKNPDTVKTGSLVEEKPKPVVYLQHGLLCSSADWVMGPPDQSLGFILADAGYDVWLGNYRGNTYGRAHCTLDPKDKAFWKFSWDEMGKYDIPAIIETILKATNQSRLHYIGHSMGTTGFMAMANERPEIGEKVIMANLLAPVAFVNHMRSPIRLFAPYVHEMEWIERYFGFTGEFLPNNYVTDWLARTVCDDTYTEEACESLLFLLCGFDKAQMNSSMLETIWYHTPAGVSTNTVFHYAQEINSERFAYYDYGRKKNMIKYGTDSPPDYSFEKITTPVSAYWSLNDWLAQPKDVKSLLDRLPNKFATFEVPFAKWNHLDFLYGIDANTLLYPEILKNMARAQKELAVP